MVQRLNETDEDCPNCHAVPGENHTVHDVGKPCAGDASTKTTKTKGA